MPLYIGDYLADTARLTTEQHGAYLLLLMDYWRNGPLPADLSILATFARLPFDASSSASSNAMAMLTEFFTLGEDGKLHHSRVDRELALAKQNQEKLSNRGKANAAKRWGIASSNAASTATSNASEMLETSSSPSPSPSPLETKTNTSVDSVSRATAAERIYQAYPRKVAKAKALAEILRAAQLLQTGKDWPKLAEAEAFAFLHEKTTAFANSPAGQAGEFTPHPSTWFHQGRYLDDPKEWNRSNETTNPREITSGQNQRNSPAAERLRSSHEATESIAARYRSKPVDSPIPTNAELLRATGHFA